MTEDDVLAPLCALLLDDDLPGALAHLVRAAGLTSAVLRDAAGDLLAVAGEVVHAVPERRGPVRAAAGSVELPVPGSGQPLATLTVSGARPSVLPLLRAATGVLALGLRTRPAADLLVLADDDLDEHADALHDGPVQALVAARWAVDAATRAGVLSALDAEDVRSSVQEALVGLRRALWHLRPRGAAGLAEALPELATRVAEAGGPGLSVSADAAACRALAPVAGALAYRLVQSAVLAGDRPVRVAVRRLPTGDVALDLDGAVPLAHPDRWRVRLAAVGGDLSSSAGRLRVRLPARAPDGPPATPAPPPPAPACPPETKACS